MLSVEYLAGFVDGEGSLSLNRIPRRDRSTEYCVRLSIANSNNRILREIQFSYGGTLALAHDRNPRWKPGYALIWTNAQAAQMIRTLGPLLRVKARQAKALLEFADHIGKCRRRRDQAGRLLSHSKQEMEIRRGFFNQLKHLNARGKRKDSRPERPKKTEKRERENGVTAEYVAGFTDGEGSIMITKSTGESFNPSYRARIYVANTNKQVLSDIREEFGGIPVTIRHHRHDTWKTGYGLVWTNGMVRELLRRVGPHLRIKRRQADLVLRFADHIDKTPMSRKGRFFIPHPRAVVNFREALYQRMKRLNMRGRRAASA